MYLFLKSEKYWHFGVVKKLKNGHNFWLRAPWRLLRSFLEVAFFWSFRGRNLSFVFLVSKIWKKCDGGTKKTKKLKNGHYFWLRAPRRVLSSFLKVAFFWSFLGWNLIFCISCYKNLKKVWWWHKKWFWIFFFANRIFFWDIEKNCRHHHFFVQNTEKINCKGCLPGINWNLISKHKIQQYYGFCNRRFSVFHKKNCFIRWF